MNGMDVVRRASDRWIVDFGCSMSAEEASLYEAPFEYVRTEVWPVRKDVRREGHRRYWWRLGEARPGMRAALHGLSRYIATPRVAKHRVFVWLDAKVLPDCQLVIIARNDDFSFGVLHSRFHEAWALRLGTSLEDRPRYTPSSTFETFPFPQGMTLDVPLATIATMPKVSAVSEAAKRLDQLRSAWLNPPELVRVEPEVVPGFPDRLLPRDDAAAKQLAKRTLTALYNDRPTWLDNAHAELDAAVAAAYGWPADISTDAALERLLELNLQRTQASTSL
jgi:type II restriction/modification system DNA methylase subunit YeeA